MGYFTVATLHSKYDRFYRQSNDSVGTEDRAVRRGWAVVVLRIRAGYLLLPPRYSGEIREEGDGSSNKAGGHNRVSARWYRFIFTLGRIFASRRIRFVHHFLRHIQGRNAERFRFVSGINAPFEALKYLGHFLPGRIAHL